MYDIANEMDIIIKAMETDSDYIHLMVDYPSIVDISILYRS